MSSPEKERGSGAPIPLGTSPVKDEEREEIEDALEVDSEVEKTQIGGTSRFCGQGGQ